MKKKKQKKKKKKREGTKSYKDKCTEKKSKSETGSNVSKTSFPMRVF
jgi:hypothetical protein